MQKINITRSLLALSAIGFGLSPFSHTAEAKGKGGKPSHGVGKGHGKGNQGRPPAHAPAYGQHDRDGDYGDYNDDSDDGRDYDRNGGRVRYDNYGRIVTLEAVVTRVNDDNRGGTSDFSVRSGGRSFDVTSDSNVRVRPGQRVILRGSFDQDDNFNARTVSISGRGNDNRNDNDPYGNDPYGNDYRPGSDRRVNFPGVVTRVFSNGELEVRAENGRTYRVEPRADAADFQVGSRVRVTGTANGSRVEDARLSSQKGGGVGGVFGTGGIFGSGGIFGNGNNDNGADYGNYGGSTSQKVKFSARIVRISSDRRSATVRGDDGRQYTVRSKDLKNYRDGDRIRVSGTARYGVIEASDIDHI